uniref:C2H2-type domain-containing protein n=1 Tax=Trichogramma kaykai TaxID=54128 RepID=A0ABD2XQN9_9HYME
MDINSDVVRVKEEPRDTWTKEGGDYVLDSVDSCKTVKIETFPFPELPESHMNSVHIRSKPYECEICHKSYCHKDTLKSHINLVHVRSKLFECEICHKSFGYQSELKRHVNAVHDRSKPFECNICRKSFGQKSTLKTHLNITICNSSKLFYSNPT